MECLGATPTTNDTNLAAVRRNAPCVRGSACVRVYVARHSARSDPSPCAVPPVRADSRFPCWADSGATLTALRACDRQNKRRA